MVQIILLRWVESAGQPYKDLADSVESAALVRICVWEQHQGNLRERCLPFCRAAL